MLAKIKNLFKKKPAHVELWNQMVKYARANHIHVVSPRNGKISPRNVGRIVGQQIFRDFRMGKKS